MTVGFPLQANAAFLNEALRAFGDQPYNAGAGSRIVGGVRAADARAHTRKPPAPADVEKVRCECNFDLSVQVAGGAASSCRACKEAQELGDCAIAVLISITCSRSGFFQGLCRRANDITACRRAAGL